MNGSVAANGPLFKAIEESAMYTNILDLIADCKEGKNVYLRNHLTAADVIMHSTVHAVLGMIERGQVRRAGE